MKVKLSDVKAFTTLWLLLVCFPTLEYGNQIAI